MIDQRLAPYAALILRVALGLMFISHAYLKFSVFTMPGFEGYLAQQGLPTILAWPIVAAEFFGGLAILLGVYARAVAILLLPILLGAISVHAPNGWVFNAAGGGWEYPAILAVMAVVQALVGDGALALKPTLLPGASRAGVRAA
jgi:putative oxidoreductase